MLLLRHTLQRYAQHIHVKMVTTRASSESFVSNSTAEPPLAKTQVLTIWFNRFATGIYLTLPYTLSVFMVRSFVGTSASEEEVGRNTGILAAAASAGQTLSAFMWGTVSDRVGRKPVLMVGNMSACLSVTALGLAPDYPAAVASRFVGGLFTAASGVALKSIIAESYGPVGQAKVIGYTTAGYSIGAIAGPIIGGVLAVPCDDVLSNSSLCNQGAWLLDRPFLLPCLVSACMSGLAFLSNLCLMSETNPRFTAAQYTKLSTDIEASSPSPQSLGAPNTLEPDECTPANESCLLHSRKDVAGLVVQLQAQQLSSELQCHTEAETSDKENLVAFSNQVRSFHPSMAVSPNAQSLQPPVSISDKGQVLQPTLQTDTGDVQLAVLTSAAETSQTSSSQSSLLEQPQQWSTYGAVHQHGVAELCMDASLSSSRRSHDDDPDRVSDEHSDCEDSVELGSEKQRLLSGRRRTSSQEEEGEDQQPDLEDHAFSHDTSGADARQHHDKPWYKQGKVVVCLTGCALITLCKNYLDELAPIFASANPREGGLAMSTTEFAWPLSFAGLTLMLFSVFVYPKVQKKYGLLNCCRAGLLISMSTTFVIPTAYLFVSHAWVVQAFMFLALGMRSISKIMSLSSSTIIVNCVAPMKQIGSVNGAGQTVNALARSVGPLVAGVLWGQFAGSDIAGKQYLPFLIGTVALLIPLSLYMRIDLKQ